MALQVVYKTSNIDRSLCVLISTAKTQFGNVTMEQFNPGKHAESQGRVLDLVRNAKHCCKAYMASNSQLTVAILCRQSSPPMNQGEYLRSHSISSADLCAPATAATAAASLPIASLNPGGFPLPTQLPGSSQPTSRWSGNFQGTQAQPMTSAFGAIAASWPAAMPYLPSPNTLASISLPYSYGSTSLAPPSVTLPFPEMARQLHFSVAPVLSVRAQEEPSEDGGVQDGSSDRPSSGNSAAGGEGS